MASLFKPSFTRKDPKTGKRIKRKTTKWYGQYTGPDGIVRRVPLCTDKAAAQTMLNEIIRREDRKARGLIDPHEDQELKPIAEHIEAYQQSLEEKGNDLRAVEGTIRRVKAVCEGCGFKRIGGITGAAVSNWLAAKRKGNAKGKGKATKGIGISTSNGYLVAIKSFCNWLVRERRMAANPITHLQRLNAKVDVRRERRALSADEFAKLIEAARKGDDFRDLSGSDREMLYLVAGYTGLRVSELASLKRNSFDLDSDSPTVSVAAGYSKRRRLDVLPLRRDLADKLKAWLDAKPPRKANVWPGSWKGDAAEMLRLDLAAAEIPYEDDAGRVCDFHALRHTFISSLAASGVHPKIAQELARHSTISLTMDRYTHVGRSEAAAALKSLPALPPSGAAPLALMLALNSDFSCPACSGDDPDRPDLAESDDRPKSPPRQELCSSCRGVSGDGAGGTRTRNQQIMRIPSRREIQGFPRPLALRLAQTSVKRWTI
ncbi:MAG: tyrosine-type recombinase/integrase [Planctomycetales bacterium]